MPFQPGLYMCLRAVYYFSLSPDVGLCKSQGASAELCAALLCGRGVHEGHERASRLSWRYVDLRQASPTAVGPWTPFCRNSYYAIGERCRPIGSPNCSAWCAAQRTKLLPFSFVFLACLPLRRVPPVFPKAAPALRVPQCEVHKLQLHTLSHYGLARSLR